MGRKTSDARSATLWRRLRLYGHWVSGRTDPEGEKSHMHTKTISMLLGAVLSTGVVLAQAPEQNQPSSAAQAQRSHPAPNPDRMAKHLGKKLGLSQDQVAQIKPVLEDRTQKMQALRADTSL